MERKVLNLIRGIPGSGKSTLANKLSCSFRPVDNYNFYNYKGVLNDNLNEFTKRLKYKLNIYNIFNHHITEEENEFLYLKNNVNADNFMIESNGSYLFNKFNLGYCHETCRAYVEFLMKSSDLLLNAFVNYNDDEDDIDIEDCKLNEIYVDNTFITFKEMKPYYELANNYGWKVKEIICKSNFNNIHNVPQEKINQMKKRFEY